VSEFATVWVDACWPARVPVSLGLRVCDERRA
jgi:hypothetical protein